jgi:hypothetical protein
MYFFVLFYVFFVLFYVLFVLFYVFLCCSMYFCVVLCIVYFVSFSVLFACICVLNNCHRVATQLQLNISYHINTLLAIHLFYEEIIQVFYKLYRIVQMITKSGGI